MDESQPDRYTVSLLTLEQVADQLKVSIFAIRRWIHQGILPAYRVGRGWRVGRDDLDKWLETHRQARPQ